MLDAALNMEFIMRFMMYAENQVLNGVATTLVAVSKPDLDCNRYK